MAEDHARSQTPTGSSGGSIDDEGRSLSPQWDSPHRGSKSATPGEGTSGDKNSAETPMQKRRRVTRACDECRRKKIKCDGKQPCTHCTVYSYDCTYDQPSNRRRNPAPQYVEGLEAKIQKMEALLNTVLPGVDVDSPEFETRILPKVRTAMVAGSHPLQQKARRAGSLPVESTDKGPEALLESMVEATGQLNLDDNGNWDYHGHSSGMAFMAFMRSQLGGMLPEGIGRNTLLKVSKIPSMVDSPKSAHDSPMDAAAMEGTLLPSREIADRLIVYTLDHACSLMNCVHRPTFESNVNRLFDLDYTQYTPSDHRFLSLFYVVLAVGCLYSKDDLKTLGLEKTREEGMKYFLAARKMVDVTECRDLTTLQTIIFMILFLQSSARMSTCYSYVSLALSSSLRMGLHRAIARGFNPIEQETRRRTFWVVRKLDTYVGALLGLPKTISDEDIDQEMPLEIDDEFITDTEILPMPQGQTSIIVATNAHTRLLKIVAKIVKYIYPIKGMERGASGQSGSYAVSLTQVRQLERDLQEWQESLPPFLTPGNEAPPTFIRAQHLLRMSYAHAQMLVYRPFLHYVDARKLVNGVDGRTYACGAMCVYVARNIIHITEEMKKRGLLNGAYWFNMYTTFFAIISLVFYLLQNPTDQGVDEMWKEAESGKNTLAGLSDMSLAALRCSNSLETLWQKLPERRKAAQGGQPILRKKRQAPEMHSLQTARSNPDIFATQRTQILPKTPVESLRRQSTDLEALRQNGADLGIYTSPISAPGQTPILPHSQSHTPILAGGSSGDDTYSFEEFALPDISAMMFPTRDPFAYPKNAHASLDNLQFRQQHQGQGPMPPPPPPPQHHTPQSQARPFHTPTMPNDGFHGWNGDGHEAEAMVYAPMPTYLMGQMQEQQAAAASNGQAMHPQMFGSMSDLDFFLQPPGGLGDNGGHQENGVNVGMPSQNGINGLGMVGPGQVGGMQPQHQQQPGQGVPQDFGNLGGHGPSASFDFNQPDTIWADVLLDQGYRA